MNHLKETIDLVYDYLEPFLSLANSHTVDFIVNEIWESEVPEPIKVEVQKYDAKKVLEKFYSEDTDLELLKFFRKASTYTIDKSGFFLDVEEVKRLRVNRPDSVKVTEFMSSKKLHEIEIMSDIVALISSITDSSLVLDIGSGKGYLTSVLALHYKLRVLGIDCSQVNVNGATRTTLKLEKKWKVYEKLSQTGSKSERNMATVKEQCSSQDEYYNKYKWKSKVIGDLYKQRVENISEETDITDILMEEYSEELIKNVLLVGLHTCGNLASSCLKLFVKNPSKVKSVLNVGCCYHLLEEKYAENPNWLKKKQTGPKICGFPLSDYLTRKECCIGRDARMCGTQKPIQFNEIELVVATKPLFYRALLQKLFTEKCTEDNFPQDMVGRIAHKCQTFSEYALKAIQRLNINIQITVDELEEFQNLHMPYWEKLKIFFLLKTALSPVIETVILLDRLLYLYEENITNAFVTRLFNPTISPRCYALAVINDYIPQFKLNR